MHNIKERLEKWYDGQVAPDKQEFEATFQTFISHLNRGTVRAAEPDESGWRVNEWVKKGILLGFRMGILKDYSLNSSFRYFDKHTYPLHPVEISDNVRIVPGGTSIRTGSHIAKGVVIMPPAYINVGAYVGANTMIDSHALVGSCAQIGARVHLSAGAQIGGVLEPIGAMPVIIEDDVLIGGNCGVYEGTVVRKGAVLGAGTILTSSMPVYDLVHERIIKSGGGKPLIIPENAVVVPGTRPITKSNFAVENDLSLSCAIIVKYRDDRTDKATKLEDSLR